LPFFLTFQLLFSIKESSEDSSDEDDELSPKYCVHTVKITMCSVSIIQNKFQAIKGYTIPLKIFENSKLNPLHFSVKHHEFLKRAEVFLHLRLFCSIIMSTVCRLSLVATNAAFASNFNAESIIYTWNFPAKTKMVS
jgi:hypothetical protein